MRLLAAALTLCLLSACAAPAPRTPAIDAAQLVGIWKVDLRATPVEQARINVDWGAVRIGFVTNDQSGPYNHSATLQGGRLEGLTNSTGRDFLAYWSAVRSDGSGR